MQNPNQKKNKSLRNRATLVVAVISRAVVGRAAPLGGPTGGKRRGVEGASPLAGRGGSRDRLVRSTARTGGGGAEPIPPVSRAGARRRVAIERADGWPSRATCSYAIASQSFVVSLFRCFV
jgi:hypothetical protein